MNDANTTQVSQPPAPSEKRVRFLQRLFQGLNGTVPGLGTFSQAAVSPVGAALSMTGDALASFTQKVKEFNQTLDTPAPTPIQPSLPQQTMLRVPGNAPSAPTVATAPPQVAEAQPDYAAITQSAERTAQSLDALTRTVVEGYDHLNVKLDTAIRQIQNRLDTNR